MMRSPLDNHTEEVQEGVETVSFYREKSKLHINKSEMQPYGTYCIFGRLRPCERKEVTQRVSE